MKILKPHRPIESYLTRYKNSRTNQNNRHIFEHLIGYLSEIGVLRYQDVTLVHLDGYHRRIAEVPFTPSMIRAHLQWVKGFFKYLEEAGLIFISPADALFVPKYIRVPHTILTPAELNRLFSLPDTDTAIGLRDLAILRTSYACCLKADELLGLGIPDVNVKDRELLVRVNKRRVLPIDGRTASDLNQYIRKARPRMIKDPYQTGLWLSSRTGRNLSKVQMMRIFRFLGRRSKITAPVSPHTLRRAGAVDLLKKGVTPEQLSLRLGYTTVKNLPGYVSMRIRDMRKLNRLAKKRKGNDDG